MTNIKNFSTIFSQHDIHKQQQIHRKLTETIITPLHQSVILLNGEERLLQTANNERCKAKQTEHMSMFTDLHVD